MYVPVTTMSKVIAKLNEGNKVAAIRELRAGVTGIDLYTATEYVSKLPLTLPAPALAPKGSLSIATFKGDDDATLRVEKSYRLTDGVFLRTEDDEDYTSIHLSAEQARQLRDVLVNFFDGKPAEPVKVQEPTFAIGDRVRLTDSCGGGPVAGDLGTIKRAVSSYGARPESWGVKMDSRETSGAYGSGVYNVRESKMELVTPPAEVGLPDIDTLPLSYAIKVAERINATAVKAA